MIVACSGPGAAEAIFRAIALGWVLFAVTGLGFVATAAARWWLGSALTSPGTLAAVVPVLLHPGVWVTARGGDCGIARVTLSWVDGGVAATWFVAAILWAFARRARERRRTDAA